LRLDALDAPLVYFPALESADGSLQQLALALQRFNDNPGPPSVHGPGGDAGGGHPHLPGPARCPNSADVENLRENRRALPAVDEWPHRSDHHGFNELKVLVDNLKAPVEAQDASVGTEVTTPDDHPARTYACCPLGSPAPRPPGYGSILSTSRCRRRIATRRWRGARAGKDAESEAGGNRGADS
jgi:hypothetical protein